MSGLLAILQFVLQIAGALARRAERQQLIDAGRATHVAEIAEKSKAAAQEVRDLRARLRTDADFRRRVRERAKRSDDQPRLL